MVKVAVAMSGGVDSSAAAFLLKEQGHEVIGITLRLWHHNDERTRSGGCCSIDDIADARRVCDHLGIRHYVLDLEKEFCTSVVDDFVGEYLRGRTPNPCIVCNEKIKFGLLLQKTLALGFDRMATGHYVCIESGYGSSGNEAMLLKKGKDSGKDQSYVLYRLTQKELAHLVFPLGDYSKSGIRAVAERNKLPVAHKPESQEICFIDKDYASFLRSYVPGFDKKFMPGPIVNAEGATIGTHRGLPFYTIGQRSGLGLTSPRPLYVNKIEVKRNRLVVGEKEDVFFAKMTVDNVSWIAGEPPSFPFNAEVKIRRQHHPAPAVVKKEGKKMLVEFEVPQMAITPGQSAVFYDGDYTLGGGLIAASSNS